MGIGAYNEDETVSDQYIAFVGARAEETGLIITTGARVSSKYGKLKFFGCYDDSHIPRLHRLAEAAHRKGSRIFLQILELGGADPLSPRVPSVCVPIYNEEWKGAVKPIELEGLHVEELIGAFSQAALRAQEAGFDGVELDGAENFLISDFLCPCMNRRTDEYGGSFENRMRFPVEIVRGIKRVCGEGYPVGFKFNAYYDIPDGIDLGLGVRIAKRMAEEGVAYIHGWSFARPDKPLSLFRYPPMPNLYQPRNTTVPIAKSLKDHINGVPVITVGGILKPDEANRIIAEGRADMVAIGRAFIADHLWAYKALRGLRIRPCIRCHVCHHEVAVLGKIVVCAVNPDVLVEKRPVLAGDPKEVMVVGGGPGGMTAALTASRRGHRVRLYEKEGTLGGKLIPGSRPGFKHEFSDLLRYFREEIGDSGVQVVNNCGVTPELIREQSPDVLIVAIGAEPRIPDIPGIRGSNVIHAEEALLNADRYRERNIAVIGGGDVGCETALMLALKGNDVTVVEMLPALMETEEIKHNTAVLEKMLIDAKVKVYTDTVITGITMNSITVKDRDGSKKELFVDTVVLAAGFTAPQDAVGRMLAACKKYYALGDCTKPGRLRQAIEGGYRIGCMV